MREIGVTDSSSPGSNTSTISLDCQVNNTNHGTVTGFISVHRAKRLENSRPGQCDISHTSMS
jgi:hypothetical protein